MSAAANWSYTAPATLWRKIDGGKDEFGDPMAGYWSPEIIYCDYQGGLSNKLGNLGLEFVAKNTFWTELADAQVGDFIMVGEWTGIDPVTAGADEIRQIVRYADTFDRVADDFALITGV
ncbi:hypothetical protein KCT17_003649 [Escherichia coli]|nr:hypothetical protein [Escherichia coli]